MNQSQKQRFRFFLKDSIRQMIDFHLTDQNRGIEPPPIQKSYADDAEPIDLLPPAELKDIASMDVYSAILNRRSRRKFRTQPLDLKELSLLLWATQGIRKIAGPGTAFRTVPSAGCRHSLETYLCVLNIEGLDVGIYHYLPIEHKIHLVSQPAELAGKVAHAALGQDFIGRSAVTFVWTAIPYRMEWRYDMAAHKVIALDAGHVCQNLYIASEAISAGTCAIAAYHQDMMDGLLGVDGVDEFTIYLAPVGKV